ncbi:MAG: hypothetical protein WC273_04980 [Dehalococcoidia bacterium]
MSRYLLVPGDPASIPAAVERACAVFDAERGASFVLLTPRPRGVHNRPAAEHVATAHEIIATAQLDQAGVHLERSEIGDASPLQAVRDELRAAPGPYDGVILAARPPRLARMLGLDVHARARRLPVPVTHVYTGHQEALADPLIWRVGRHVARLAAPLHRVARAIEHPRGIAWIVLPMVLYLAIGLGLAIFVNHGFFFTDAVALALDVVLLIGLVAFERAERRRLRRRLLAEEGIESAEGSIARTGARGDGPRR